MRPLEAQRRSATGSRASRILSARASNALSASISSANLASARAERPPQPGASRQHAVPAPRPVDRPAAHPRTAVHAVTDEELPLAGTQSHPIMARLRAELSNARGILTRHHQRSQGAGVWTPSRDEEEPIRALRSRIDDLETMLHSATMRTPGDSAAGPVPDEPELVNAPAHAQRPHVEAPAEVPHQIGRAHV